MHKEKEMLRVIELSGTHRQIGEAYGEECKDGIQEFLNLLKENVKQRIKARFDDKLLYDLLRKHWAFSIEYAPELQDEIEGLARGAGLSVLDIVFLNAFLDIVNTRDDRVAANVLGCTSFGATKTATEDGKCYIGQNYDMEAFYKKYMLLLKIKSPENPDCLVFTYQGIIGCNGINSDKIGVCINFLHARDSTFGIVYPFVVRKILSQRRIGDAIGAATVGYRAGGTNYMIGDSSSGLIFDVETSSRDHDIIFPTQGIIAHTNHYLSLRMQKYDLVVWDSTYDSPITRRGSTIIRWYVANETLQRLSGHISIDTLKNIACDQTNSPFSICCTGNPSDSDFIRGETNASIIFDLENTTMYLAPGNPRNMDYCEVRL